MRSSRETENNPLWFQTVKQLLCRQQNCLFSLAKLNVSLLHRTGQPHCPDLLRDVFHVELCPLQIYMLSRSAYADATHLLQLCPDLASRCSPTVPALGSALCWYCPVTGTAPMGLCRAPPAPWNAQTESPPACPGDRLDSWPVHFWGKSALHLCG